MRKMTTKLLAIVLALVMVSGIAPMTVFAQDEVVEHTSPVSVGDNKLAASGQCGDNVYWSFVSSTGALTISGTGKMYDYNWNGSRPFYENSSIKSVTVESGVTSIGDSAFSWCSRLTSITIPDSVTSIGEFAFYFCKGLTAVYITDINAWAQISFGSSAANPLYYAKKLYLNNELVESVVLSDSVTSIGSYAFCGCSSLRSVTIPDSVTSISKSVFYNCNSLTSIEIPDSVTSIGEDAFSYCSSLTSVTIPDSVTCIGEDAFSGCSSLTSIEIPDSVTSIGDGAFYDCSSLRSVTIPDSVTSMAIMHLEIAAV